MWENITGYKKNINDEKNIEIWELKSEVIRIVITNNHILYKPKWIMRCDEINIDTYLLTNCKSSDEAKIRSIAIVKNRINKLNREISRIERENITS